MLVAPLLLPSVSHRSAPPATGLPESGHLFVEVFEQAGGEDGATPLTLMAVACMMGMFSWAIGDEAAWAVRAERLESKARALQPGIEGASFTGFGEAGRYFRHVLKPREGLAQQWLQPIPYRSVFALQSDAGEVRRSASGTNALPLWFRHRPARQSATGAGR